MESGSLERAYLTLARDRQIFQSSLQECAERIVTQCVQSLAPGQASIWVAQGESSLYHCQAMFNAELGSLENNAPVDGAACLHYFAALRSARYLQIDNVAKDPRIPEPDHLRLVSAEVSSLFDFTLRTHGRMKGFLRLETSGQERVWNRDERMFIAGLADLFSQRLIIDELARSEDEYRSLYEYTSEGIAIFSEGKFADANPAACRMYGGTREEIVGRTPLDVSPEFQSDGEPSGSRYMQFIGACMAGKSQNFEWLHTRLDGSEFHADITLNAVRLAGEDTLFALIRDITDKKNAEESAKFAKDELFFRAAHDTLTGLMNRDQLHFHIGKLIIASRMSGKQDGIALLLLDLNRFKEVNDTLGHANGDKVLIRIADILKERVDSIGGDLFRLGGDEFVAVFSTGTCPEPFSNLESILHNCLKTSLSMDDISIEMSASMGIALYPENGQDSHELLRCADVAMYHSKSNEASSSWYDPLNDPNNKRRLAMMVELGSAISSNELTLHFQPKIKVATGEVTGCEALIRWEHPKHGLVSPAEFIPLAEMSELIHPLSDWVVRSAIDQVKQLNNLGFSVPVAINISGRNLTDSRLIDNLHKMVIKEGIDPSLLEIEVTESALINHPQRAIEYLEQVGELGIKIAIDDFGTGYSSLSYLKKLPLNTLKIDGSFVKDMLTDDSDSVIVDSTISLAHNFSLTVVAEGVEDQKTMDELVGKNCDQAQGYFIARPMPASDLHQWLYKRVGEQHKLCKAS